MYVIIVIAVGLLCGCVGMWYGSRIGMGEILALLIACPECTAQNLRDGMEELAHADGANFEERCGRWAVRHCDKRIEFFKSV